MEIFIVIGLVVCFMAWVVYNINQENKRPYERTFTTSIKVPAKWATTSFGMDEVRSAIAEFGLGEGPCGLTVTSLYGTWSCDRRNFSVKQYCSDGSSKLFHYRREDLTGRIEETFKTETVTP